MGRTWKGLVVTTAALIGLAGCGKHEFLQPPKPKDEYTLPPSDDPRFTNPPKYPNKLLNQDNMLKPEDDDGGKGPGRPGGGMHAN